MEVMKIGMNLPYFTKEERKVLRWSVNKFGDGQPYVWKISGVSRFTANQLRAYIERMLVSRRGNEEANAHGRVIKMKLVQHIRERKHLPTEGK